MLIVLCRDKAPDHATDWEAHEVGVTARAGTTADAPEHVLASLGFEPAMVIVLSPSRDARGDVYEMAEWIAHAFRGAWWSEDTDELEDVVTDAEPPTLEGLMTRWREQMTPRVEAAREAARTKRSKLEESYARAQAGERVEHFDWQIDFDDDAADARAAAEVSARIAADKHRAAEQLPVSDPRDLRGWLRHATPTLRSMLESAVLDAATRTHVEVTVPHWLLAIVEREEGDPRVLCATLEVDPAALRARLEELRHRTRVGAKRPVFAPDIAQLIRVAWDGRHAEQEHRVRSGHVLWAALRPPLQGREMEWWRYGLRELLPHDANTPAVRAALADAIHTEAQEARRPPDRR